MLGITFRLLLDYSRIRLPTVRIKTGSASTPCEHLPWAAWVAARRSLRGVAGWRLRDMCEKFCHAPYPPPDLPYLGLPPALLLMLIMVFSFVLLLLMVTALPVLPVPLLLLLLRLLLLLPI
eukprot:3001478-Pyramimonas_sp.AAC.1